MSLIKICWNALLVPLFTNYICSFYQRKFTTVNLESATKLNKSSNSIIEFKINFKKLGNIGCGCVENSFYLFYSFFPC